MGNIKGDRSVEIDAPIERCYEIAADIRARRRPRPHAGHAAARPGRDEGARLPGRERGRRAEAEGRGLRRAGGLAPAPPSARRYPTRAAQRATLPDPAQGLPRLFDVRV